MGANAQTTVPTFTTGQVLTADQQNQSARTGVPVFATTTARNDAFGGTGEKTLAEGQLCYVEGTGLQTYNGSAWVTWGTAPTGGLTLISTTTIGTAVASVTVSNAFSSTYDNYKIMISGGVSSATVSLRLQLGAVTSGYRVQLFYAGYNTTPLAAGGTTNASFIYAGNANSSRITMNTDIMGPNLAKPTQMFTQLAAVSDAGATQCYLDGTDQFTSFTIIPDSGTLTGGTIRIYGYQNS